MAITSLAVTRFLDTSNQVHTLAPALSSGGYILYALDMMLSTMNASSASNGLTLVINTDWEFFYTSTTTSFQIINLSKTIVWPEGLVLGVGQALTLTSTLTNLVNALYYFNLWGKATRL